ncbi:hypothetical protein JX265_009170 [Neoarthrinium moseri]|uniref:DUF7137 domain-containing protein n=1 Tax=Neoarthrinium moseri TaxID=1658444 RepID=A0A9Q0ALT3_9PEZI|nr:hypothetical protein JX266_006236 [Neoarthrinium moseri]KAI1862456.1 hypothetical protein JX265_009170 [Neoarthrinium moseri]
MKGPRSFGQLLTAAVALSSTVSAWPGWLPEIDALVVRQDDATTTAEETGTPTADSETTKETATATDKNTGPITTNLNTGGQTDSDTATKTSGGSDKSSGSGKTTATSHKTFNAQDPAGGVSMITPATASHTQLYRLGDTITWVWNYTSLQGTPTALDLLVSCSAVTQSWTLTQNMSYEATGSFTWDTNGYQATAVEQPLLTQEYTMVLYDADSSVSATAEAGYLGVFNQFTFGLYQPQSYKNLTEWNCVTCSAAMGDLDRQALRFAFGMATLTVLSFTWFVAGFGALL